MPFGRFDGVQGRSKQKVKNLLDGAHRAVLSAFGVPQGRELKKAATLTRATSWSRS